MLRPLTCAALGITALVLSTATAQAAESLEGCAGFITSLPVTITTQGVWCLDRDLATSLSSGSMVNIATNNVILDCNHFKLGNLAAGPGTSTFGVRADNRLNATIRNCNIRGFGVGIYLDGGGGHLVEDSRLDGNVVFGIYLDGAGSTIRNNVVVNTGGSTTQALLAQGIYALNGVDIINNTVNGVSPPPAGVNLNVFGIRTSNNGDGSIKGNRVRGLMPLGSGVPYGIYSDNSGREIIRSNDVQGPGPGVAFGLGVRCTSAAATARDNVIAGFATGISGCSSSSNYVNPN